MGLMVGAAVADSFGVAPGAEWITAGVIDQGRSLPTTLTDIMEAFQWALNPDGDTLQPFAVVAMRWTHALPSRC